MLNIVSNEYFKSQDKISGPIKVFRNLIKGLELIGYPFVVNHALDATSRLWIYNDSIALIKCSKIDTRTKILLGPGFYLERCLSNRVKSVLDKKKYELVVLQPSKWSVEMLLHFGYNHTPVEAWPTGIDTYEFSPRDVSSAELVLIYFKQRHNNELDKVISVLNKRKINHRTIVYGNYDEITYKKLLQKTRYIIWVGRQESQGIAFEEALSMDIPILVWDVDKVGHWLAPEKDKNIFTNEEFEYTNTTVAPYFDERCGIKFTEFTELEDKIEKMENFHSDFRPREYVMENLTLEKQAREFINIYDKYWNLKYEDGLNENLRTDKKWKNEMLWRGISKSYYFFNNIFSN